jgi:hypothetical protein
MSELRIPYRDRSDSVVYAINDARAIEDPDERRVVRDVLKEAAVTGAATIGQLLDRLEGMTPNERRRVVDEARVRVGLRTIADEMALRDFNARSQAIAMNRVERDARGLAEQVCAVKGCNEYAIDPVTGAHAKTAERRWHCPAHVHLAGPTDLEAWQPPQVRYSAGGGLQWDGEAEAEAARVERELERVRQRREARRGDRAAEAAELRVTQQAERRRVARETPPGVPLP